MNPVNLITLDATLTRTSTSGTDVYNNPVETTTTASVKCWLEQDQRDEVTGTADIQTERWRIYLLPAAAPVSGRDRITVDTTVYEFTGPPWTATNPRTGEATHIEGTARRVS